MNNEENCYLLKPIVRQDKNITYKGKKYLIDFQLLQQFSNYFNDRREEYSHKSDIEIPDEIKGIDDSSFEMFIKSTQGEKFSINEKNIFSLNLLSNIYEIPSLKNCAEEYINKHNIDLVLSTLMYKESLNSRNVVDNINEIKMMGTNEEEEKIATNFEKYINRDELFKLSVPVLYRILNHPKLNIISEDQIIHFLIKYLKEHKRTASVLFLNDRFNFLKEETFFQLLHEYSDIFDNELLGRQQIVKMLIEMKQSKDELSKNLKETNDNLVMKNQQYNIETDNLHKKIQEIQKERDYLISFVDQIRKLIPNKNDDELIRIIEDNNKFSNDICDFFKSKNLNEIKGYIFKDVSLSFDIRTFFSRGDDPMILKQIQTDHNRIPEINKLENNIKKLQNKQKEYENNIKQLKDKEKENDKIINHNREENLKLIEEINKLKENQFQRNISIEKFNKLPFLDQKSFFEELASNDMPYKIKHLLIYLSRGKNLTNSCIEISYHNDEITKIKEENEVKLLSYAIEHLFKNKMINTDEFIKIIKEFNVLHFEINYPQPSFQDIYNELSLIKNNLKYKTEIIISISSSMDTIMEYAFERCTFPLQITIPPNITSIGNCAFFGCSSLTQITIPSTVTSIGNCAFFGCSSLTQITIPSNVTSIGYSSFRKCSSLTQITIPSTISSIGYSAFRECSSLTKITILFSVKSIEDFAFSECTSLTQITIPSTVTSIGNCSFLRCSSLKQITIPSSVTSIGNCAFSGCSSLTQIAIPLSLKSIDHIGLNSQVKISRI